MGRKVIAACGGEVRGKRIAILGLTFKPNTDDMRDSPSIAIIRTLQDAGARIAACDPEGIEQARTVIEDVEFVASPWDAIAGAAAAVIVTEWDAYRALDLSRMKTLLAEPVLVDLRNIYDREAVESAGLSYHAVGR
jgi:UDPglucose 6-dehydrogenase